MSRRRIDDMSRLRRQFLGDGDGSPLPVEQRPERPPRLASMLLQYSPPLRPIIFAPFQRFGGRWLSWSIPNDRTPLSLLPIAQQGST